MVRLCCRGRAKSHALGQETHDYDLDLELYGAVDQDSSKISVTARHIVLVIAKKPGSEGFWPRLTLDKSKQPNIKVSGLHDNLCLPDRVECRLSFTVTD